MCTNIWSRGPAQSQEAVSALGLYHKAASWGWDRERVQTGTHIRIHAPCKKMDSEKKGLSLLPVREISPPPLQDTEEARKDQRGLLMGSSKSHFLQMRTRKKGFPLNTNKCLFLSVMLPPTTLRTATRVFLLTYSETSRDVGYKGAWKARHKKVRGLTQSRTTSW